MIITICGSIRFMDKMYEAKQNLETLGHEVLIPVSLEKENGWTEDRSIQVEAQKKSKYISMHLDKIAKSDAVLIVNIRKKNIRNYIGANTFLEIGFAHYRNKKIFFLNPIPNQPYIIDEIEAVEPQVINGDYTKVS